jgi:EAL domain-containing protein (putative c-di-GMP-specific phosphodiesterase class I)
MGIQASRRKIANAWQRLGLPRLKLGVNVSPSQLTPEGAEALAQPREEMRSVCDLQIEISSAHLVSPVEGIVAALHTLRFAGADISVQHFGWMTTPTSGCGRCRSTASKSIALLYVA